MLLSFPKRIAARLPQRWQQELKRHYFRRHIRRGTFRTNEPEWEAADRWLSPGDWAIDVGANIGHYTSRFSQLVGPHGRVIAFEPVLDTFELLAANACHFAHPNVTLLNLAASDSTRILGVRIADFDVGLKNYYEAALTTDTAGLQVMTCSIDSLAFPGSVRLLKVDAEGHDGIVIRGARALIARDRPTVVIESVTPYVVELMDSLGYRREDLPGSPNTVYNCPQAPGAHLNAGYRAACTRLYTAPSP